MLALRIIATVFMALSCISTIVLNGGTTDNNGAETIFSLCWRAFVIVALWLI